MSFDPSAYVHILWNQREMVRQVGSLGRLKFAPGFYLYVGSGGANALKRVQRHLRATKPKRWHVDYLTTGTGRMSPVDSHLFPGADECGLAGFLGKRLETIERFGSSDCRCRGHLFFAFDISILNRVVDSLVRKYGRE